MRIIVIIFICAIASQSIAADFLKPADSKSGYLAHLLINEIPFPGESGWVSEEDTKAAMLSILYVLDSRINHIPPGYRQTELATVKTKDIIDVMTAGGVRGQCDGFYRDKNGNFKMVARVPKRISYLSGIAGKGKPGKFARLLNYGQGLADAYFAGGIKEVDKFASLRSIGNIKVTGKAYSWMTDKDCYHPGGDYIKIPDNKQGSLGGNRFSTLKKRK